MIDFCCPESGGVGSGRRGVGFLCTLGKMETQRTCRLADWRGGGTVCFLSYLM